MGMFDDLDTLNGGDEQDNSYARIRAGAHVVNGGEATFDCPACKGSGVFRSYTGRVVGNCFKCKGAKKIGARAMSAHKGQQTRKENDRAFTEAHRGEHEYMVKAAQNGFQMMGRLLNKWNENGRLHQDEIETVRKYMRQDAERREARNAQIAEEKKAQEVKVELSAIDALFATATDNRVKRPIFRADTLEISKAAANGRNAGALYVKRRADDMYLGMIKDGVFQPRREATQEDKDELLAIAADPLAASIKYARRTGRCGCCGHTLVDPVSILAGIGPICAENYGLDYRRELAADEYAAMKEAENPQTAMKI